MSVRARGSFWQKGSLTARGRMDGPRGDSVKCSSGQAEVSFTLVT